jgi:hypothetical protein
MGFKYSTWNQKIGHCILLNSNSFIYLYIINCIISEQSCICLSRASILSLSIIFLLILSLSTIFLLILSLSTIFLLILSLSTIFLLILSLSTIFLLISSLSTIFLLILSLSTIFLLILDLFLQCGIFDGVRVAHLFLFFCVVLLCVFTF